MKRAQTRRALSRRHITFLKPLEDRFAAKHRAVMRDLRGAVDFTAPQSEKTLREWQGRVVEAMAPVYHEAMLAAGRNYLTRFMTIRQKAAAHFQQKAARKRVGEVVMSLEEQFRERLEETVATTFDSMEEILTEAAELGLDEDEIEDLVNEEFEDVLGYRTDAIATSEMNGAVNSVNDYLSLQLAELGSWITAADDRVRVTHEIYGRAGAKPIGFDWATLIPDAGYTLRYPCDPECHEPAEIVNCRCFEVPSGEVELPADEMADYLEDFEMDPEDILTSESIEPVYVTNQYTGKAFDPDQPRDELGRWASIEGRVKFDESTPAERAIGRRIVFDDVREQLSSKNLPPVLAAFIREKGLKVKYEQDPDEWQDANGNTVTTAGSVMYDPRYQDAPVLTLTSQAIGESGFVAHEIGHLISHATLWGEEHIIDPELSGVPKEEALDLLRAAEPRLELIRAYQIEGGVTPYAMSYLTTPERSHTGMTIGAAEQFAEVEGIFQHAQRKHSKVWPETMGRSERELSFAISLATKAGTSDTLDYPGGVIQRTFPRTARAWLRHRGASRDTIRKFDEFMRDRAKSISALVRKEWSEEDHPREPAGGPEGGQFVSAGGGGGEGRPSMTEVGRALAGAPKDYNSDPRAFAPLKFGKTQTGEKREAAVQKAMGFFGKRFVLRGGKKEGNLRMPATSPEEMKARMDALFKSATPEEMKQARWYKEAAGKTVDDLHAQFAGRIPGLGKDQVAGILASASANNVWDDKYGTDEELGASNQKVAETILRTWADNKTISITAHDVAMATVFTGSLTEGAYKGMKMPKPGDYPFQALARSDPRLAYLFNTSWAGADVSGDKPTKPMGFGGMPGHVLPSLGLLRGDAHEKVWGGEPKVRSFYSNITHSMLGEKDPNATIDIWMARAMLDKPGEDGPIKGAHYGSFIGNVPRYEGMRRMIAENAAKHGLEPKEYQAVVWYVIRNQYQARERARGIDRAHEEALKMSAREAKKAAQRLAQLKLFTKAFEPGLDLSGFGDQEYLFAWLARFMAHEKGVDVSGDPVFGEWDEFDEEAAREWRGSIKGVRVCGNILTFVVKGDYEGHPFRGNQWTSGYAQAKEEEPPAERAAGEREEMGAQTPEQRREIAAETAKALRASLPSDEEFARLKKEEEETDWAAKQAARRAPLIEARNEALVAFERAKHAWEDEDRALGNMRDKIQRAAYEDTLRETFKLHPTLDPNSELAKKELARYDAAADELNAAHQATSDAKTELERADALSREGAARVAFSEIAESKPDGLGLKLGDLSSVRDALDNDNAMAAFNYLGRGLTPDEKKQLQSIYDAADKKGENDPAYKVQEEAVAHARLKMDEAEQKSDAASAAAREGRNTDYDEWAVKAGPGYFARKALEDDTFYEKNMDDLRGAWIPIGGEQPMRVRVATGIGLGLEQGAVFDRDLGRFLKVEDYGDLRDDAKTIMWAGLLQREYLETQEDIASGKMEAVLAQGERHMGTKPAPSAEAGDSPEETMSDDEKYDMDKAHQAFYESDAASEAEFEAKNEAWNDQSERDKLDVVADAMSGKSKDNLFEIRAAAAKLYLSEEEGVPGEKQDDHLREALGDKYLETDATALHEEARGRLIDASLKDARDENSRAALIERMRNGEAFADKDLLKKAGLNPEYAAALQAWYGEHKDDVDVAVHNLKDSYSTRGYTKDQIASALTDAGFAWIESHQLGLVLEAVGHTNSFIEATSPTVAQHQEATQITEDDLTTEASVISEENRRQNLHEYADSEMDDEKVYEAIKEVPLGDLLDKPPKWSEKTTFEDYAREKFDEDYEVDPDVIESAFNSWWEDNKGDTDFWTEEFQSAMADYENQEGIYAPKEEEDEGEEEAEPEPEKQKPVAEERKIKLYRGLRKSAEGYVPNFVESYSTSRKMAREFGATDVIEDDVPIEKILVFQGARNWRQAGAGSMGQREMEVMVLSDFPKWYREAYRRALRLAKEAEAKG